MTSSRQQCHRPMCPFKRSRPSPWFPVSQVRDAGGKRIGNAAALTAGLRPLYIASVPTAIGGPSEVEWSH